MDRQADYPTGKILKWSGQGSARRAFVYFPNPNGTHVWGCGSCKWTRSLEATPKNPNTTFAAVQRSIE
jgi:hypothetical protein